MHKSENIKSAGNQKFLIYGFPVFDILTESEKELLQQGTAIKKEKRKKCIYSNGDGGQFIYYLVSGKVKLGNHLDEPNEIVTGFILKYNFFGMKSVFDQVKGFEFAYALTDVTYLRINLDSIHHIITLNKNFTSLLFSHMYKYVDRLETRIEIIHQNKTVKERLVKLIFELANESKNKAETISTIEFDLTHQDLADYLFTSRQSVTRIMNELKEKGLIDYSRNLLVIKNFNDLKKEGIAPHQ